MLDLIVLCILTASAGALLVLIGNQISALLREGRKAKARAMAMKRHKLMSETAARNRAQIVHDLTKGVI